MLRSARAAQKPSKSSGKMKSNTSTPTDTDTTGSIGIKPHPTAFHFCLLPRCQPQYRHASACVRLCTVNRLYLIRKEVLEATHRYARARMRFGVPESMSPCWRPEPCLIQRPKEPATPHFKISQQNIFRLHKTTRKPEAPAQASTPPGSCYKIPQSLCLEAGWKSTSPLSKQALRFQRNCA